MLLYVFLFFLIVLYYKRYKSIAINFITLFYLFAALASIYVHFRISNTYNSIETIGFHVIVLFLFMLPIFTFCKNEKSKVILHINPNGFKIIATIFIGLNLFSVIYFIPIDIKILLSGNLGGLRNAQTFGGESYGGSGFFRTIAGVAAYYYGICLILYFYSITFLHESKRFNNLLLIASTSRVFHALSYIGRDGILFWVLSFIFLFCVFYPYMNKDLSKLILKRCLVIFGFVVFVFLAISISRFKNSAISPFESIIDYYGQGLNNFGQLYKNFHEYTGNKTIWPWLYGEKGVSGNEAVVRAVEFELKYGFKSNVFFTYVGNLYRSYGSVLTIIIAMIFSVIFSSILKGRIFSISKLIVLFFVFQIVICNYFYYFFANRVGNLYILSLPFIIYLINSYLVKKSHV